MSVPLPVLVDIFCIAEHGVMVSNCALLCMCIFLLKRFCIMGTAKSDGIDVTLF